MVSDVEERHWLNQPVKDDFVQADEDEHHADCRAQGENCEVDEAHRRAVMPFGLPDDYSSDRLCERAISSPASHIASSLKAR